MSGSNRPQRVRLHHLTQMKERSEPITMLTCYDAVTAQIFDNAAIDMLLVGIPSGTRSWAMAPLSRSPLTRCSWPPVP